MPDLIAADRVGASACVVSAMTIAVFKPEALMGRSSEGQSSWLISSVSEVRVLLSRFASEEALFHESTCREMGAFVMLAFYVYFCV